MEEKIRERKPKREFSNDQRNAILQYLLSRSNMGKMKKGSINAAATQFKCHPLTISRIWKRALENQQATDEVSLNAASRKGNSGRKRKDFTENVKKINELPAHKRKNIRMLAREINVPKTTLFRILKRRENVKEENNAVIEPHLLTDENKRERVKFCLSKIAANGYFENFFDTVHIDKKWFYLTRVGETLQLTLSEKPSQQICRTKGFIAKVMFLAAVARPRFNEQNYCTFDGKIGIWPFTKQVAAKRENQNRPKGSIETKSLDSITEDEVKKVMLEKLYPAIKRLWPTESTTVPIHIQQGNAKPHVDENDPCLVREGTENWWNIRLKSQPANSPDFNVLELGFFHSIRSLEHQKDIKNIDDLVAATEKAFYELSPQTLNMTFLSYQHAMMSALKENGSCKTPITLECSPSIISSALKFLAE